MDWQPRGADAASWRLWKLGQQVDPGAVLRNGSHSMHAVGDRGFHVDAKAHGGPERLSFRWSPLAWQLRQAARRAPDTVDAPSGVCAGAGAPAAALCD